MFRRYRNIDPDADYLLALQIADDDMLKNVEANLAIFSPAEMPEIQNTERGRTLFRRRWGVERADVQETKHMHQTASSRLGSVPIPRTNRRRVRMRVRER